VSSLRAGTAGTTRRAGAFGRNPRAGVDAEEILSDLWFEVSWPAPARHSAKVAERWGLVLDPLGFPLVALQLVLRSAPEFVTATSSPGPSDSSRAVRCAH